MRTTASKSDHAVDVGLNYLAEAMNIFDPLRFRAWAELGLTTAQLRVLFLVRETPGVTAGALATRLAVTPPTISGIVDRLVKLGLVRREDDESDRRLVRNHLTEPGQAACSRLERDAEAFTRRILVEMKNSDLAGLIAGLQALINASRHVATLDSATPADPAPGAARA